MTQKNNDFEKKSLTEFSQGLKEGEFSSRELTQYFLDRIEKHDDQINSFITQTAESALSQAASADEKIAAGEAGTLTGIPLAHKDIFCSEGVRTTCGSKMLESFVAPYSATVVARLEQAGCVSLGKLNMDEFAMGASNETSYFGAVKNPWDTNRVPGGSSGGSAASVAAGLVPAATGTDTGGSIRQPAALCGITGMKPSYGRVSRWGMIAFASSLDQAGVLTRSAEDAALLLGAMSGFDEKDSTSLDEPVPNYVAGLNAPLKGLRIGVPSEYFTSDLQPETAATVEKAINDLLAQGAERVDITLPNSQYAVPTYYIVAPAEASSNLSRYDGVRYGHRCENPENLEDLYKRSRGEGFGDEVKRRIMVGTYALSAGYYDAYYLKAQKVRRLISADFDAAFENVDLILAPTTPEPAFELGAKSDDPVAMYLADLFTIAVNLAGLPAISVPCGQVQGLPVGMQLIGPAFAEERVLAAAHQYQQITDWHLKRPSAFGGGV